MYKGLLVVVSSPSGGGKGTILAELFKQNDNMKFSVSATTRKPREGEINGVQYHFISKEEFEKLIAEGKMLEYASYCDNFYGTPKEPVEQSLEKGIDVILEIEVQGGAQIKKIMPECVSIFIAPPSLEVLEKRLRGRGTETDEVIKTRLETAKKELEKIEDYDYLVINDELETAVKDMETILKAEKLKTNKQCIKG